MVSKTKMMTKKLKKGMVENKSDRPFFLNDRGLKLLLFGGKGGVGKTTCATASAIYCARRVFQGSFLLISTDPAHSLEDSMAGSFPPPNLEIVEFDANDCLAAFKAEHNHKLREIAARGTFLDNEDISKFLDLSLPGLDELMAFLEIARWVEEGKYDCIFMDTAPTGHTMRLLAMPEQIRKWLDVLDALLAKHRYMKKVFAGSYRRDNLDHFLEGLSVSVNQLEVILQDSVSCRFVPVMVPEALSIRETVSLMVELKRLKVPVTDIVLNRLYPNSICPVCAAIHSGQMRELTNIFSNDNLSGLSFWGVPVYPVEVCGTKNLNAFWENATRVKKPFKTSLETAVNVVPDVEAPFEFPRIEKAFQLFSGKGGVGKTTLACATALRIAKDVPGKEVFLFSTDPAHSLSFCLDVEVGPKPKAVATGLTAMEIDAQAEFEALKTEYHQELEGFLAAFNGLDLTFDREVMEKILDLAPPGLDEVMALSHVMDFLSKGSYDYFILDSAPTGHLIRLLELPKLIDQWLKVFFEVLLKYREVFRIPRLMQRLVQISKDLKLMRTLLDDGNRAAVSAVAILTEMAFQETRDLIASCERLGANAQVLFLNLATPVSECSLCAALHERELQVKEKFEMSFSEIHQTLVYRQGEPRGLEGLTELGQALYE